MRIAHVTSTFPPYQGGTGNVCYYNARELARRCHDVHVFTTAIPNTLDEETIHGFTVHRLRPLLQIGNASILPQLLWRLTGFDIVHVHCPFIAGTELSSLSTTLHDTPLVITYHSDLIKPGSWRDIIFTIATLTSRYLALNKANGLIFVSEGQAKSSALSDLYFKHQKNCFIVPNGIDTKLFTPGTDRASTRQSLGISLNSKIIGFIGKLDYAHHYKGLNILLEAISMINLNNTHLLVIGDGDMFGNYQEQAIGFNLKESVYFVGNVDQNNLPPFYRACDVVVMPSLVDESFGLVAAEALSCGIPVIASEGPGVKSFLQDGKNGFLVKPGDVFDLSEKILNYLNLTYQKQQFMGSYGNEVINKYFTLELIGNRLEEIYYQVISS